MGSEAHRACSSEKIGKRDSGSSGRCAEASGTPAQSVARMPHLRPVYFSLLVSGGESCKVRDDVRAGR